MSKWIPVSERLPNEKGYYLVTYHPCYYDNVSEELEVCIALFRGEDSWPEQKWPKQKYMQIVAWMPLPEPWKRADDSEDLIKRKDAIAVCDILPKLYGKAIKLFIKNIPSARLDSEKSCSRCEKKGGADND